MKGISASPGMAIAKALVLKKNEVAIERIQITDVEKEKARLTGALSASAAELQSIRDKALVELGEDKAEIFDAHLLILNDPEIKNQVFSLIVEEQINSEYAYQSVTMQFIQMFEQMDNAYMKERSADIRDVSDRVLNKLLGIEHYDLSNLHEDTIVISHDLTPSETATMDKKRVVGFATNIGGKTSHTAIMARSLEIPAIVGLKNATENICTGDLLLLNGIDGDIIINPTQEQIGVFNDNLGGYQEYKDTLKAYFGKPSKTKDGHHVELAGNIGSADDITSLISNDAEGVGLFRTEFLYMNRSQFPTEDEQFESYKTVLEEMYPKPIVIRTLDIGGDKKLDYFNIGEELNPFLGYRAIRICLDRVDIFKTQLRALLRASVYGNLRIMFPMISSLEELIEAKSILDMVRSELEKESIPYNKDIQVGMMIEIPAAALMSDVLAKHVDFFSIGTNDLIQYTCAVDRMNERIAYLYNPYNPALIRLIKTVIDNGHKEGIWVGMCGELAGNLNMIPLLLGLGLDEFSMSPSAILPARKHLAEISKSNCESLAKLALSIENSETLKAFLNENIHGCA